MAFPVVEHFVSINGEGTFAGQLAVFIRFKGCNLQCSYCDTRWANEYDRPAQMMEADEIVAFAEASGARHVTLTGGEPLLQRNLPALVSILLRQGFLVEIETNGALPIDDVVRCDDGQGNLTITLDYKLPSSGMTKHMLDANYPLLRPHDVVKFVIGSDADFAETLRVLREYDLQNRCQVHLSPVFERMDPSRIVDFMRTNGLSRCQLQLQLHKLVWPMATKGV